MLTSAEAPNGRKLYFYYAPVSPTDTLNRYTYCPSVEIAKENDQSPFYLCDTLNLKPYLTQYIPYYFTNGEKVLTKESLLDSIATSDKMLCVRFGYQQKDNQVYDSDIFSSAWGHTEQTYKPYWSAKKYFLTQVYARTSYSDTLCDWHLSYISPLLSSKMSAYTRQYLQRIERKDARIAYRFEYNFETLSEGLPNDVNTLDVYGYRINNPTCGVLTGVTDPLGKKNVFAYTCCRYDSIRILHKNVEQYTSVVEANNAAQTILHTVSLESVSTLDKNKNVLQKTRYEYGWFDENSAMQTQNNRKIDIGKDTMVTTPVIGVSSGVLHIDFAIDISADGTSMNMGKKYALCPYFTPNGSRGVEYSCVKEYVYGMGGRELLYKNVLAYNQQSDSFAIKGGGSYYFDRLLEAYPCLSMADMRNKLIRKEEYDHTQHLHKVTRYAYSALDNKIPWSVGRLGSMAYKIWIPVDYPIGETILEYENNGVYEERIKYIKDHKKRAKELWTRQGDMEYFIRYTYPDNIQDTSVAAGKLARGIKGLVEENRIAQPIEVVRGIHDNNQDYITAGDVVLYKYYQLDFSEKADSIDIDTTLVRKEFALAAPIFQSFFAPYATLRLKSQQPVRYDDFHRIGINNGSVVCDSRYDTVATYTYNGRLRMTSVTPIGQPTTRYGWDSRGLYVISESVGAFSKQYTYIPYVGISSETDAKGLTTYYKYDALGNIVEIYQYENGKKMILKAYTYHYSGQE